MKKIFALIPAVIMVISLLAGCRKETKVDTGEFTYHSYSTALGTNWNPHNWDTGADSAVLSYLQTPLVDLSIKDSREQIYQWIYLAATSITDVTRDHKDDLVKYAVTFAEGRNPENTDSGYVFEIRLNDKMKWQNGDPINADTYIESMELLLDPQMKNYRANLYYDGEAAVAGGAAYYHAEASADFASVGLYKVDAYTIRYITQTAVELNDFLTSCTGNWIVHKPTYEAGYDTAGALKTTDYNSSKETTMSCGPYKIESIERDKQIIFTQNESWYDWETVDGQLVSFTDFTVDGKPAQQYQTTRVVIDVIADQAAVKQAFLKGELDIWEPEADDLNTYGTSDRMYKADEAYTMSLFFNTNEELLRKMDQSKGNINSVVLTNSNFRKAMSLAIDRADWVKVTAGYTPAYAIMNDLYYYDVYNDPSSSYRKSAPAMEAICKLYGVEYGEGKAYGTLREAYKSINGLNMTGAKKLMAVACEELAEQGLYKKGEKIVIHVGWAKGALTAADEAQIAKLEGYFNEAMKDSGFGALDLVAVGNINDRYSAVPAGEYAIGYGAWGGAVFYPFRNFQVYCDPDLYAINEAANWDPRTETLTLKVGGKDETMTWQQWSGALMGNGKFANADFATKLQITADMEYAYLNKFYRIPMAGSTTCSMLSYKLNYYTEDYNIMYGWGGLRLAKYNYNDADWEAFKASQGGELKYM